MTFDIYKLDEIDNDGSEESEIAVETYQDELLNLFVASPEGQAFLESRDETGFWAAQLIHYGYSYIGVSLTEMDVDDVNEIISSIFPRKISLSSPDDADDGIPELIAFWAFLKREFKLRQGDLIIKLLRKIEPHFKQIMNDPANFGMAKSFMMAGQAAGYDMTDQEEANRFIQVYNAGLAAKDPEIGALMGDPFPGFSPLPEPSQSSQAKKAAAKKKKQRKMAKASRKKNRKKKGRR